MKDLIIIGGSAAAASAGIYAARRNLDFQIITKEFGGEVATSGEVGNYLGFVEGVTHEKGLADGFKMSSAFKKHLEFYNVKVEEGIEVESIEGGGGKDGFKLKAKKLEEEMIFEAKSVIIATGVHPRLLGVPGEDEFKSKGVSYCSTCDGPLFKDKVVAVVGGGNSALESGIMLSGIATKTYVLTKYPEMKGEKILIEKLKGLENVEIIGNAMTSKINGEGMVKSLEYKDEVTGEEKTLEVEGIFVNIGRVPNSDLVESVEKDKLK